MMHKPLRALPALFLLCGLAGSQKAADGDTPAFEFQKPPMNAMGLMSLEEFHGKPLLIDFWGTG